jgi:hypothetical protein
LERKDDLVNPVGQTKNDKENNNDDNVAISTIKMKWNNKQKNIVTASTWSTNLIMKKNKERQDGL